MYPPFGDYTRVYPLKNIEQRKYMKCLKQYCTLNKLLTNYIHEHEYRYSIPVLRMRARLFNPTVIFNP